MRSGRQQLTDKIGTTPSKRFRGWSVLFLLLMAAANTALAVRSFRLEQRLDGSRQRVAQLESRLDDTVRATERQARATARREELTASRAELLSARSELDAGLARTRDRLATLEARLGAGSERVDADLAHARDRLAGVEARLGAGRRVIADAAESILFLQGSYGFVERATGRPLRHAGVGADGEPLTDAFGNPLTTFEEAGPVVEHLFTGSAFVAHERGILITNRHVARPWEGESLDDGLEPVMWRFLAYPAGSPEAFEATVEAVSDTADVAVLRAPGLPLPPLPLSAGRPHAGDEVLLLGYPTGLRALMARADEGFVRELLEADSLDGWSLVARLAEHGGIAPLATRGIVGHRDDANVIYDADTATGGSGGPLLDLGGEVVAVNAAILPEFGGSNLGVPIAEARRLIEDLSRPATPPSWPALPTTLVASAVVPDSATGCPMPGLCDAMPGTFPLP